MFIKKEIRILVKNSQKEIIGWYEKKVEILILIRPVLIGNSGVVAVSFQLYVVFLKIR